MNTMFYILFVRDEKRMFTGYDVFVLLLEKIVFAIDRHRKKDKCLKNVYKLDINGKWPTLFRCKES